MEAADISTYVSSIWSMANTLGQKESEYFLNILPMECLWKVDPGVAWLQGDIFLFWKREKIP